MGLDGLVGHRGRKDIERGPIHGWKAELSHPTLQGDEDKIVPPNQVETMHRALLEKKVPTALKIYEGEQHGFRKSENIEDALNSGSTSFRGCSASTV